jgi:hypothetical protein
MTDYAASFMLICLGMLLFGLCVVLVALARALWKGKL